MFMLVLCVAVLTRRCAARFLRRLATAVDTRMATGGQRPQTLRWQKKTFYLYSLSESSQDCLGPDKCVWATPFRHLQQPTLIYSV